jgi:hypothetical protein
MYMSNECQILYEIVQKLISSESEMLVQSFFVIMLDYILTTMKKFTCGITVL